MVSFSLFGASPLALAQSTNAAKTTKPAPKVASPRLLIKSIEVRGVRALTSDEVRNATQRFIGLEQIPGNIKKAVETIENLYRSRNKSNIQVFFAGDDKARGAVIIEVVEPVAASEFMAPSPVAEPAKAVSEAPAEPLVPLATERFSINAFAINGVATLGTEEVRAATANFIGANKDFGDVQKALEAIEGLYRNRGYSAVEVFLPEQDISTGTIEIRIVEAKINKVIIGGNNHFREQNILASLPELSPGKTPNVRRLSENIQLANSNPSKQVNTVLSVGEDEGSIDARVTVTDQKPLRFVVSADNTGNDASGKHRASVAVQHANLWDLDHVATLSYGTSIEEPSDVRSISLSYRVPFYRWGDSLDAFIGKSDSSTVPTGFKADVLQFNGGGTIAGLKYTINLPRQGEYVGRVMVTLDERRFTSDYSGQQGAPICLASPIACADHSVRPISLGYAGNLQGSSSATDYTVTLIRNLGAGAHGDQADIELVRTGAKRQYQLLRMNAQWIGLLQKWQARIAANFQYSSDPLIGGEQIGLAGSNAVRGFEERAFAADTGIQASLEIYTPSLGDHWLTGLNAKALVFVDGAYGKNEGLLKDAVAAPAGASYRSSNIASAGFGLRLDYTRNASFRWDTASVVKGGPLDTPKKGDWRTHFSILLSY